MPTNTTATQTSTQPSAPPFTMASAFTSRTAFSIPQTAMESTAFQPTGFPANIPAFGWLSNLVFEITVAGTTGGVLGPDGVAGLIQQIGVRTSAGQPLIPQTSGYNIYLDNKYGGKTFGPGTPYGINADPLLLYGTNIDPAENDGTLHFFLALQFEVDHSSGFGCIPATSGLQQFTVDLTFAGYSTAFTTAPSTPANLTVAATATAWYWDLPSAGQTPWGVDSQSQAFRLFQTETRTLNSGNSTLISSNKGNVIMNTYFKTLNASGARDETDMATQFEIDMDNSPRLPFTPSSWRAAMCSWFGYGLVGTSLDKPGGQDSGVFVVPWRLLAGGQGADPASSHAQYFPTLSTSTLAFVGNGYGSGIASAEIITDSISTPNPAYIYSK